MNFQEIDSANGNNVAIWATMTEHLGVTQKDGKLKLKCKLKDDNGITHNVHIHKGNGELPGTEHLEKRMEFNLNTFQGNYQGQPYTGYSGFWNDSAQVTPQNAQQAPSQAAQSTNYQLPAPQQGMSQQDAASFAINAAARIFGKAPKEMPANEAANLLIQIAEPIKEWILGKQYNPNQSAQDGPIEAQFCDECRNLKEECTCGPLRTEDDIAF